MDGLFCSWELLHACNYRCPYCPSIPAWEQDAAAMNRKHLSCAPSEWIDFWRRLADRHGAFRIQISGGEPFIFPDFPALIREIVRWHQLNIITNLSWDVVEMAPLMDPDRVSLLASFHPHFAQWPEFSAKLTRLRDLHFRVSATMVAYPSLFDRLAAFRQKFNEIGLWCDIVPFNGVYQSRSYPESYETKQQESLREWTGQVPQLFDYGLTQASPLGKPCATGMTYFRAYPDGWIYRCISSKDSPEARPLASIRDADFHLSPVPTPCSATRCLCPVEYCHLRPGE